MPRRENTVPLSLRESAISIVGQFKLLIVNRSLATRSVSLPQRNDRVMSDVGLEGSEFIRPRQEY